MHIQGRQSQTTQMRDIPFWNVSGETAPAYACLQIKGIRTESSGHTILEIEKPDGTGTIFGINKPFDVLDNKPGRLTFDFPATVFSTATGEIGPTSGSWFMTAFGSGYHTISNLTTDNRALVMGGVGGAQNIVWFIGTLAADLLPGVSGNASITPGTAIGSTRDISSYTLAENPWGCAGCAGESCLCMVDLLDNEKVRLVTVQHKLLKPLLTVYANATTMKLEATRQPTMVMFCGPVETFDLDDLADCP